MIFGKYINRYYLKHAPVLLLGLAALLTVDYIQLLIPQLYRLVINGVNLGQVVVNGETLLFTKEVLLQHICLPMIWIVVLMVIGRFLWRICFFGSAVRVAADLRERMFDHSRRLSQQYYQVNKVGNLMSLYTNDLDTIQECFGDGVLMFFDALTLGLLALYKMWTMDVRLTLLALIPALLMFAIGTQMSKVMTRRWEERQEAFSGLSDFAQENFSGIAVIKAFVKEYKELQAFRKLNKENERHPGPECPCPRSAQVFVGRWKRAAAVGEGYRKADEAGGVPRAVAARCAAGREARLRTARVPPGAPEDAP